MRSVFPSAEARDKVVKFGAIQPSGLHNCRGRDRCPARLVHSCMNTFSAGQRSRMSSMWNSYRLGK